MLFDFHLSNLAIFEALTVIRRLAPRDVYEPLLFAAW